MQDRAAMEAARDHGRALHVGGMGDVQLIGDEGVRRNAGTDTCAGSTGWPTSRSAAEAEAQSSISAAAERSRVFGSWQGPQMTGALPFSTLDLAV
jgi:hypothetical protein